MWKFQAKLHRTYTDISPGNFTLLTISARC